MPRTILLTNVLLLLGASIHLGAGLLLVFGTAPPEAALSAEVYRALFSAQASATSGIFAWISLAMLACAVLMLLSEWFSGLRFVPVVVLAAIVAAMLATRALALPLDRSLAAGVADPAQHLRPLLERMASLNRIRLALSATEWTAMAYWFYRMALKARGNR